MRGPARCGLVTAHRRLVPVGQTQTLVASTRGWARHVRGGGEGRNGGNELQRENKDTLT